MSQLLLTLLQLGFLVLLWFLVVTVIGVLRADIYGTKVVARQRTSPRRPSRKAGQAAPATAGPARPGPPEPANRLVVTAGPLKGQVINLGTHPVVIGRATDSTIVLEDDFASSRHARLSPGQEGWVVEDLGSTNGTKLNGVPLEAPAIVVPGATLQIGQTVLELRR